MEDSQNTAGKNLVSTPSVGVTAEAVSATPDGRDPKPAASAGGTPTTLVTQPPAVIISHVTKRYRLGQYGHNTLQQDINGWLAKRRGEEDPSLPIGYVAQNEFLALDDVSLTIQQGEAYGIIGRNGAGKSTLLKLLCQITAPTSGDIDINGRIASMLEVGTGFDREMTGRENVYLNGSILGMSRSEIDSKMDDIIEFSEIGRFIDTPVKRYSSGMYVKLAFSVAAHLDCEIMVMDEVLSVGDVPFRTKCIEKMKSNAGDGRTILYVSHNMNSVRDLCDRCAVLDHGHLIFEGDTEQAIRRYLDSILVAQTCRDLSQMQRSSRLTDRRVLLAKAEFVGKSDISFERGEHARMRFTLENLKDYEDLCLRLEVWSIDDHLQASYVLYDICSGRAGQTTELDFDVDLSPLAPATYKFKQTFFFRHSSDSVVDTDRVIGLFFEVKPSPDEVWDSAHWGSVRLPGLSVIR